MRKLKKILVSLTLASALMVSSVPAFAEETETDIAVVDPVPSEDSVETDAAQTSATEVEAASNISSSDCQTLATYAQESIAMITSMSDAQMEEIINPSTLLSVPQKSVVKSVTSWLEQRDRLGAFEQVKKHTISVSNDSITIVTICDFANQEGMVTTTLDRDSLEMDSMSFAANTSSLGQAMKEAGLNTIMGLGVVFLVLWFLAFLIGQLKHLSRLESPEKKETPAPAAPAPVMAAPAMPEADLMADQELVAVITAAIAAAEGTTTEGFVVRTIRKSRRSSASHLNRYE